MKRYGSVADVLNSMDIPEGQKERQVEYIKARQLSRLLSVMRSQKRMSQTQAAEKLGWSQGRVSKLETKEDRAVAVGDLLDYANALDLEMAIVFLPGVSPGKALTVIGPSLVGQMIAEENANLAHA